VARRRLARRLARHGPQRAVLVLGGVSVRGDGDQGRPQPPNHHAAAPTAPVDDAMVRALGLLVALLGSTSGDDVPPCAVDPWVRPGRSREPTQVSRDFAPYVAPTPAAPPAGSPLR
jgi:hypothetical protein